MLKTITFFIKPYKLFFALVIFTTIVTSVFESLHVAILLLLFNAILSPFNSDIFNGMPKVVPSLKVLFPFKDAILSIFVLFIAITIIKTLTGNGYVS